MFTTNINPSVAQIQRIHLWERLQRRAATAQQNNDQDLLALLNQEAKDLGYSLFDSQTLSRRDRTLQALQHLQVRH
jgi:hypothetical protein